MLFSAVLVVTAGGCAAPAASIGNPTGTSQVQPANISGTWTLVTQTPVGTYESTMIVTQSGSSIVGRLESQRGVSEFSGTINGAEFQFSYPMESLGAGTRFEYVGVV